MTVALYETDLYRWSLRQAELLRNEEYADLDIRNLIEEMESMGASQRRELDRRLMRILEHLLKLTTEPESRAKRKWQQSILNQRIELVKFFRANYTLRTQVAEFVDDAYQDACQLAAAGLGCAVEDLPARCPWSVEQILDSTWLP